MYSQLADAHTSGEATECLLDWVETGKNQSNLSLPSRVPTSPASRAFIPPQARARMGLPPSLPAVFDLEIVATDPVRLSLPEPILIAVHLPRLQRADRANMSPSVFF